MDYVVYWEILFMRFLSFQSEQGLLIHALRATLLFALLLCSPAQVVSQVGEPYGSAGVGAGLDDRQIDELIELLELDEPAVSKTRSQPLMETLWDDPALIFRGRTIVQMGYSYTYDGDDGFIEREHAFPQIVVRYGVNSRVQVRASWTGCLYSSVEDEYLGLQEDEQDVGLPNVGVNLRLWEQRDFVPRFVLGASLPIATEGNPFASEALQPTVQGSYSWQFRDGIRLSGSSAGIYLNDIDEDLHFDFSQTLSIDKLLTDDLGVYCGWSGIFPSGNADSEHVLDLGTWFWVGSHSQLDMRVGIGMNEAAPDVSIGCQLTFGL